MADAAPRLGTLWEQLCALPSNQVGEIVGGELSASPRPAGPYARVTSKLAGKLDGPFDGGVGGPGGWIILYEPELHLGDAVLVPDLAGWRRERMPYVAEELVAFEIAPDWICEVLSPSTSTLDRVRKMPVYARRGAVCVAARAHSTHVGGVSAAGSAVAHSRYLGGQREGTCAAVRRHRARFEQSLGRYSQAAAALGQVARARAGISQARMPRSRFASRT